MLKLATGETSLHIYKRTSNLTGLCYHLVKNEVS